MASGKYRVPYDSFSTLTYLKALFPTISQAPNIKNINKHKNIMYGLGSRGLREDWPSQGATSQGVRFRLKACAEVSGLHPPVGLNLTGFSVQIRYIGYVGIHIYIYIYIHTHIHSQRGMYIYIYIMCVYLFVYFIYLSVFMHVIIRT